MACSLSKDGFEIIPSILTEAEIESLKGGLQYLNVRAGHRNVMRRVHRRMIHLEYASCSLGGGLDWAERITQN
jgi:hypothetical protein